MTSPSPLDRMRARSAEVAGLLRMLSHPSRLLIACDLIEGERSVSEIEQSTGVHQPALSRELARFRSAELVHTRRVSKVIYYRLADERIGRLVSMLCAMLVPATAASDGPPRYADERAEPWSGANRLDRLPKEGAIFARVDDRAAPRVRLRRADVLPDEAVG